MGHYKEGNFTFQYTPNEVITVALGVIINSAPCHHQKFLHKELYNHSTYRKYPKIGI